MPAFLLCSAVSLGRLPFPEMKARLLDPPTSPVLELPRARTSVLFEALSTWALRAVADGLYDVISVLGVAAVMVSESCQ